jgi:hypothetical protein
MRITESQLRKIVRQEILREAGLRGTTFMKGPDGRYVPSGGMPDWEGEGAQMAAAVRKPRITGRRKLAPVTKAPPGADTLLVYTGHHDDEGYPSGMMHFYVGTEAEVSDFVADGGIGDVTPVEIDGDWEAEANGGPSPVAMWLKRNPSVRYVMDQQVELGDETMTAAEYIQTKMDDMDPNWDQAAWDRGDY